IGAPARGWLRLTRAVGSPPPAVSRLPSILRPPDGQSYVTALPPYTRARAPPGPMTLASLIRAAPPPGKLTTVIRPDELKLCAVLMTAFAMLVAPGPIGVLPTAVRGPVTPANMLGASAALSAA